MKQKGLFFTLAASAMMAVGFTSCSIDDNPSMFLGEKGCYLNMSAFETQNNQYGDTHLVKPNLPKEVRERMTDEERNAVPILGNMAPMRPSEQQVNGSVDANAPEGQQQNDLPF